MIVELLHSDDWPRPILDSWHLIPHSVVEHFSLSVLLLSIVPVDPSPRMERIGHWTYIDRNIFKTVREFLGALYSATGFESKFFVFLPFLCILFVATLAAASAQGYSQTPTYSTIMLLVVWGLPLRANCSQGLAE